MSSPFPLPPPPPPLSSAAGVPKSSAAKKWTVDMGNVLPEIASLGSAPKATITAQGVEHWDKLVAIKAPSAGSHDTMFVQTEDGVFVVKPDADAINEKETTEWLGSLPIDVPKIRLIASSSEEGRQAISELGKFTGAAKRLSDALTRHNHFMVMQMVPGQNLDSLQDAGPLTGVGAQTRFFMIGMLVAYDLVIYNIDRFPGVGDNEGNPGNLMFRSDSEGYNRPIAIDQQINPANVSVHIERLKKVLTDPKHRLSIATKVVLFIKTNTNLPLHPAATERVNDGIREGLVRLAKDNAAEMRALGERLESQKMANGGYGDKQLELVGATIGLIEKINPDLHQLLMVRDYE
jgi:hypothetical protein